MSTLNVADKPTLNSVKTDTDTLITRGGIRHNGTNPQVYDTTNDTWVDLPSGGSLSPTIIIKNHFYQDGDMDNLDITVSDVDGVWTTTQNMGTADSITVEVPWLGVYEINFAIYNVPITAEINVTGIGGVLADSHCVKLVSWATGTDEEIANLVFWADKGLIDLVADAGWAVGDTRAVDISAIAMSGTFNSVSWSVGESHVAQTVDLVLMDAGSTSETGDINSDTAATSYKLVTSVKNKDGSRRTNPAFIVGVKKYLVNGTTREGGYMNSPATNSGSWEDSARRAWCNGGFMSALPETLRPIFKQANVITARTDTVYYNQTTQDYCILFAEKEVYGNRTKSNATEANALKQVEWYKTSSNIAASGNWWERSPYTNTSYQFCYVYGTTPNLSNASTNLGIAPALFI